MLLILLAVAAAAAPGARGQDLPEEEDPFPLKSDDDELPKMLKVPVQGIIEVGMVARIQRDVRQWLDDEKIHYIVFELDTPGGELDAAVALAGFISRDLKKVITIAFIPPGKAALSAGALIAVAADHIIMGEDTAIGAASPRGVRARPDGTIDFVELGEKERSVVRTEFRTYADGKYKRILTDAMVSEARSDIRRATTLEFRGGDEVEVTKFYTESDFKDLKRNKIRVVRESVVLQKGELLTMTADEAREYGFAEHIVNNLGELRDVMNITIPDENVIDIASGALRPSSPAVQTLIDILNHPVVRGLLLMGGCLGLLFELKLLGTMLPGALGLICFSVFFIGAAFPMTGSVAGTASVYEIILFIVGVVLVGIELLFPGFAVFAITGCGICATSIVLAMIPPDAADMGRSLQSSLSIFLWSFVIGIGLFFGAIKYLPRIPGVRRHGGLVSDGAIVGVPTADSALEDQARLRDLLGKSGVVVSTLRPAGKVELDSGQFVDVVSNGEYIEKGEPITIEEINGPRIVVTRRTQRET